MNLSSSDSSAGDSYTFDNQQEKESNIDNLSVINSQNEEPDEQQSRQIIKEKKTEGTNHNQLMIIETKSITKSSHNTSSIMQKNTLINTDKRDLLKQKFQEAKIKILSNQATFLRQITDSIHDNNIKLVLDLMVNKSNQQFYKRQLETYHFLNTMLINNKMEMLTRVLQDPFYKFDQTFVFEYLSKKLKEKDLMNHKETITIFINNVVNNNLYRKSLTRVLGWFIISFGLYDVFKYLVQQNEREYAIDYVQYNQFETEDEIKDYFDEPEHYRLVIILCLKEKLEQLAIELITYRGNLENSEVIDLAVQFNSKIFLRYIWETTNFMQISANKRKGSKALGNKSLSESSNAVSINNEKKKHIQTIFETSLQKTVFNQGNKVFMISDLIDKIFKTGSVDLIHEIVSLWKFLDKDRNLLQALFRNKAYDEIAILLYRYPNNVHWKFSTQNFNDVIENKGLELIQLCLQDSDCRRVLDENKIQALIISSYITSGECMYYGAEMLSHIKKTSLQLSLAHELLKTINESIKNKNILNCYSPVLTCLLLCEIVANIGEISVHFYTKCKKTRLELMTFCKNIHEANPNEKYIKFLLGQKDSKGRSAYQIAAETEAFMVLESPEVGTIVNKMWVGRLRDEGLLAFSSLKKYLEGPTTKGVNPYRAFDSLDPSKTYFHQLCLWEESCSLRYYPESISTILLILLYNLFIFFLVINDEIMVNPMNLSLEMKMMMISYIVWVACIVLNIPLQILYCTLAKKRYKTDIWGMLEIALLISALLVLIDTQSFFPNYDQDGNVIPSDGKSDIAFVIRATILSVNDIFVWLRITGILLTYKELGPLIRMIYLLSIITAKYLLIYLILMICMATIYTTLFYRASSMYESYSITFTTLFQGYLNNSNVFDFEYYQIFGAICCIAFVTVGGLILVNMLIALLSNEYTRLAKVVDAAHRSVLINYFKRYKWDKNYGYLILLTTPLNVLNFLILPINLLFKEGKHKELNINHSNTNNIDGVAVLENNDLLKEKITIQKRFNQGVSRVYFTIFYFPFILLIEGTLSLLLLPVCYFVGIFSTISEINADRDLSSCETFLVVIAWIITGLPFLLYKYIRDLCLLVSTMFITVDINAYDLEKKRIKEFIRPDDIRHFLQFIHKREKTEQNDLHSIFIDYLEFEHQLKAEVDEEFKNQANYLHKLRNSGKSNIKKISVSLSSMYTKTMNRSSTSGKNNKHKEEEEIGFAGRTTKRNLIIIEILENFLIDDGSENYIVDIEKMKLLLPKTMNINNAYIKRLVHTDSASLNKAANKRKNKANAFLQHKLLNKVVGSIVRLDKVIDAESNQDPLFTDEAKKQNKFDIEDNEDDFYNTLEELLKKIGDEVNDNIKGIEKKIEDEEKNLKESKAKKEENNRRGSEKHKDEDKLKFSKTRKEGKHHHDNNSRQDAAPTVSHNSQKH